MNYGACHRGQYSSNGIHYSVFLMMNLPYKQRKRRCKSSPIPDVLSATAHGLSHGEASMGQQTEKCPA